jgi:hypothetical protein
MVDPKNFFFSCDFFLHFWLSKPWIRIGIQPKMLDPDPDQIKADPHPCLLDPDSTWSAKIVSPNSHPLRYHYSARPNPEA